MTAVDLDENWLGAPDNGYDESADREERLVDRPDGEATDGPAGFKTDQCRSCQAAVIWAVTVNAKSMPVDAEPATDGNVRLVDRAHLGLAPLAEVLTVAKQFGKRNLRKSHFVTCPQARQWRTRDEAARQRAVRPSGTEPS